MLEFLSFCVTRHLHDGRVGEKVTHLGTYFGEFGYLNSSSVRKKVLFWCFWVARGINSRFCSKTQWQMFLLVSGRHVGAHPDGHQYGGSIQISINLGKTFLRMSCIRTYGLYLLNGFDFYFDLFWMAWHWKPAILTILQYTKVKYDMMN